MPKQSDVNTSLIEAAKKIAAAERPAQIRGIEQFADWSTRQNQIVPAFQALQHSRPHGDRLSLEFVSRLKGGIPRSLILVSAPLLQQKSIPLSLRLNVAAQFLSILPDQREAVGPIVRAVTSGLNRRKTLTRLISLQSRVETCQALDDIVTFTEARVRLKCPVCKKSMIRPILIKHLWKKHQTQLIHNKIIKPSIAAEQLVERSKTDPIELDRAYLTTPLLFPKIGPVNVLQGLASRFWRSSDQYADLADRASDQHAGLCPKCYGSIRDSIPALPPALHLSHGRLSGDGYCVELTAKSGVRSVRIDSPEGIRVSGTDRPYRLSPRTAGVLFALPIVIIGLIGVAILPRSKPDPFSTALWFAFATVLVYLGMWVWRKPLPQEDDRCIDLSWQMLAPGIGRSPDAVHFLTRLCRTSLSHGDAAERSTSVWELVEHAVVLAEKDGIYLSLFATSSVLRAVDAGKLGRDTIGELATLMNGFFRKELSAPIAELMAQVVRDDAPLSLGERNRLSILLVIGAFEAGLTPTDLSSMRRFLPILVSLLPDETEQLNTLQAIWNQRSERPWSKAGDCDTIFTICKSKPSVALRTLRVDPDAVLVHIAEDFLNDLLGPVTVNRRGISFGGATVADANAEVIVVTTRTGGELVFGKNSFNLDRRPDDAIEKTLKSLLRFRANVLMPAIDSENMVSGQVESFLEPLRVKCQLCRTISLIRSGQLGVV